MCRKYGNPTWFITLTANPNWKEIVDNLRSGETCHNRPELVCRVLYHKFNEFLRQLVEDGVIGELEACIWCNKFQKRGLPHGHLLAIATEEFTAYIVDPKNLDKFISAELHSDRLDLYKKVVKYMRHGPCGKLNPKSFCCNEDGAPGKYKMDHF